MRREKAAAPSGISYSRKAGWLLAHNIVRPRTADTRHGWKDFRRFWVSPEKMREFGVEPAGFKSALVLFEQVFGGR